LKLNDITIIHPKKGKTTLNRLSKEEIFEIFARDIRRSEAEKKYLINVINITKRQRDYFLGLVRKTKGQS